MKIAIFVTAGVILGALATYGVVQLTAGASDALQVQELKGQLEAKQKQLIGYTKYTTLLTVGKKAIEGQVKLLTAQVTREERLTKVIEKNILSRVISRGTVEVSYRAEYSFGFDLAPGQFDVLPIKDGIEIKVSNPKLVAKPSIFDLTHKVLAGGVLTNENAAIISLQEAASSAAAEEAGKLVGDAAVAALCEKKLIEFLAAFLATQPGVSVVPHIVVTYR